MEGFYTKEIGQAHVKAYLTGIAEHLQLRYYGEPIVHALGGAGKDQNEGFDAFLSLIDSGISFYVWTKAKFFAAVLFTCKHFDSEEALEYSRQYFATSMLVHKDF